MNKKFKKFMTAYGPKWISITIGMGILLAASLISAIIRKDTSNYSAQLIILGIILVSFVPFLKSKIFFRRLEENMNIEYIVNEFKNSISMNKDRVRFGENYIFVKRSGKLLKYGEIVQVYQYIHKVNFVEDKRALKYVDINGRHHELCKLDLKGKSDKELYFMIALITSKNPSVKIGYC